MQSPPPVPPPPVLVDAVPPDPPDKPLPPLPAVPPMPPMPLSPPLSPLPVDGLCLGGSMSAICAQAARVHNAPRNTKCRGDRLAADVAFVFMFFRSRGAFRVPGELATWVVSTLSQSGQTGEEVEPIRDQPRSKPVIVVRRTRSFAACRRDVVTSFSLLPN